MKISPKYNPIIAVLLIVVGIFIGSFFNFPIQHQYFSKNHHKNKLNKLIHFINSEYVDDVNTDSIIDETVDNILAKLDPHSVYIPAKEHSIEAQNMKGDFVGIGINFYLLKDTIAVIKPIENGPAAKAGIQSGDRILYANNQKIFGKKINSEKIYHLFKGQADTDVKLIVYRKNAKKNLVFNVKRNTIAIKSVEKGLLLTSKTGYIKINRFAEKTYKEFKHELEDLKQRGIQTLVIDLRNNGGGYMEMATQIADELLKDQQLIVFTKNKNNDIQKTFATSKGIFETGNLFVLINENSASASEILAGAIQDNDRGTIIGRRSFGKGLVQREMGFDDGSAVRLTIARYYTPTGRSIQKPYNKGKKEYYKDFEKRFESGELYEKDNIHVNDTLKFKTPKGKIVYGGGGIVPDIFVPLDGEKGDESLEYLMQSGIIGQFVFEELDKNRHEFQGLKFNDFLEKIKKNDTYIIRFQHFITQSGTSFNVLKRKNWVAKYLYAEFARQLFNDTDGFKILLTNDLMIQKIVIPNKFSK